MSSSRDSQMDTLGTHYQRSTKMIQPVTREITTELFLLWFVPLLFNGPEDHTQSHAINHRSQENPTQRTTRLN
ncbi:uncharacterized protein [Drosophila takahashii]|uniref:uncharacterized protein isoform X8 n=1 Tax=Drosophila takahashii TaxID=29030 RepID=UPI0038992470